MLIWFMHSTRSYLESLCGYLTLLFAEYQLHMLALASAVVLKPHTRGTSLYSALGICNYAVYSQFAAITGYMQFHTFLIYN
jgi:hypothetical protein